jgi:hypothetical protein
LLAKRFSARDGFSSFFLIGPLVDFSINPLAGFAHLSAASCRERLSLPHYCILLGRVVALCMHVSFLSKAFAWAFSGTILHP